MSNLLLNLNLFLFMIFFIPSILKMIDIANFEKLFKLLSINNAKLLSVSFIIAELISSIMVLFNSTQKIGLILMGMLSFSFIVAVFRSKSLSVSVNCNCFGSLSNDKLDNSIIFRSIFFLILIVIAFIYPTINIYSFKLEELIFAILNSLSIIAGYLVITNILKFFKMMNQLKNRNV